MVYSSYEFLLGFLPLALIADRLSSRAQYRNASLVAFSLCFYYLSDPAHWMLLPALVLWIWAAAWAMQRGGARLRPLAFGLGLAGPLALLISYRYLPGASKIAVPLGISFFTFQAASYLIDLRRNTITRPATLAELFTFKTMFFQLLAGPIVRYEEVAPQLQKRPRSLEQTARGLELLLTGLAQKCLLADPLGALSSRLWALSPDSRSPLIALVAGLAFCLQLYHDFSGYSHMARGLGALFGFELPENFNFPYMAESVRDFWQRWHMSLTRWLRDYIYIPLGGNRRALNAVLVFALCGLWHGAGLTFLVWGLYCGALIALERLFPLASLPALMRRGYVAVAMYFGWLLFDSPSFGEFTGRLASHVTATAHPLPLAALLDPLTALQGGLALSCCFPWAKALPRRALLMAAAAWCLIVLARQESPLFLYYRF